MTGQQKHIKSIWIGVLQTTTLPSDMTALHIRAALLKLTASAVETAKLPSKKQLGEKISEYRIRAAALIMPNDCQIHINS
jgi:hypothetical protein